jgi:hypothetical protein
MHTVDDLEKALHAEWKKLDVEMCHKLVSSLPERCEAVKKPKNGYTLY